MRKGNRNTICEDYTKKRQEKADGLKTDYDPDESGAP